MVSASVPSDIPTHKPYRTCDVHIKTTEALQCEGAEGEDGVLSEARHLEVVWNEEGNGEFIFAEWPSARANRYPHLSLIHI